MVRWIAVLVALLVTGPMARAQEPVTYDQMRALAMGDYATLTAFLPVQDAFAPPPCDMSRPGQTYVLLLGADSFGPMTDIKLAGSGNSIALIGETLTTRGVNPGNVISLQGSTATRQGLTRAIEALLGRVTCTDMVVIYATAVMFDTAAAGGMMVGGTTDEDWIAASADSDPLMRGIVEAGPFLLLNDSDAAQQEFLSAGALSELMTLLRNRAAHVTLMMDTTYAASFDLAARQMAVDGRLIWRENLSEDSAGPVGPQPTPLATRAGAFSLFYAADKTSMSAEMQLPEGSPEAAVYGLFAFKLSAALRTDEALTMPSIARQMAALELAPQYLQYQNHLIETTDAGLPILAEKLAGALPQAPAPPLAPAPGSPEVIRIVAPELSRAAEPMDTPVVVLKGRVEWPSETLIVLVGKEQALSRGDGTFEHQVELTEGLNRIEVVALTRDNRQHTRVVEFTYAGEAAALTGRGQKYALLIANQTYGGATGMPGLQTPFADVDAVADVLRRRYGFVTEAVAADGRQVPLILRDATRAQIETVLFQLSLIAGEADQVLIYYGGHGVFEQVTGTAFWVPADAVAGVPPSYISASGISEALLRLQAGSVIVVSDSCYSGALLRDAGFAVTGEDRDRMLLRLAEKRSRVLITSGANEPVADGGGDGHSIFARAFLTALSEAEGPIAAREMFDQFVLPIVVGRADQEPQYRPIAKSGHEGGDFVFTPLER